ncbi:hypothetical protein BD311DRAFT_781968 [Dichomitus squalens]|uniref:Uncharacterized protein n=1 Tax=Dichomitus squalens TaxID=114155 RepID=A0A4Q9MB96_9APHY|nr:hypothetical protein BD311DRAFT_781968 [Dichomitus squalens]
MGYSGRVLFTGNDLRQLAIAFMRGAQLHDTSGLVALTGSLTFLEVKEWSGGKPLTLANLGLSQLPRSWVVIPPDETISRHVELLLSVETTIYGVDNL